jgi:hypothetical protein
MSKRAWIVAGGAAGIAVVIFILVWFQPQALFFDRVVDEDFPPTAAGTDTGLDEAEASPAPPTDETGDGSGDGPADPVALATGSFAPRGGYDGEGTATVYDLGDGSRTLRFEDFATSNGPDLFVYLSTAPAGTPDDADFDREFVNLGDLTGNVGAQNYDVPADVDLDDYESVVIWCRRFAVAFAAADLD